MADATGDPGFEPIDQRVPAPPRTYRELALEAALLIPNLVKLITRLLRDPRVPIKRKVALGLVLGYVVSPIDLIPDFVIGFGRIDDIVLISVALDQMLNGPEAHLVIEHWDGSIDSLDLVRSVVAWGVEIVPSVVSRMLPR